MEIATPTLIALGMVILLVLAFFSVFRYKGKFAIKTKLGEVTAEGENKPQNSDASDPRSIIPEHSERRLGSGSTEIGQVGTGASVFVAQPGSHIIVQTNEGKIPVLASEQKPAEPPKEDEKEKIEPSTSSAIPAHATETDSFREVCDTPPPTTTWVGRTEELLLMQSDEAKVIAITGIGGQGKSTLAAKYLEYRKNASRSSDWRDCKEESNTLHTQIVHIIERITKGKTRASDISGESSESVIKLFLNLAAPTDGIFVFDNIDHYVDVVHSRAVESMNILIEGALKVRGRAQFIFTCRPRLMYDHAEFRHIPLPGLTVDEARQLFRTRRVEIDSHSVNEVHQLTQGHPLWLNLIATQVLANKVKVREFIYRIKTGRDTGLPNSTLREIWRTLKPKHQTLLRFLAELVRPETEMHIQRFVSSELNGNQFNKCMRQLKSLDLVVLKSPANGPDTFELHPLIREFVRQQFSHSERSYYIFAIVSFLDRDIVRFRPALISEVSYEVLQNWTTKTELLINAGGYSKALAVLAEACVPLLRSGYIEEFVRLASTLFENLDWTEASASHPNEYDMVYENFVDTLAQLGRFSEGENAIKKFESTVSGTTARYIAACEMRAYLYWTSGRHDLAKEWGKRGVEVKNKGQIDTRHDCAHTLALARRDSGEIDEALSYFLQGTMLTDIINPRNIFSERSGNFYGNIGRCLFLKEDYQSAELCFIKSASLLKHQDDLRVLINRGWAAFWLGEVFEKRSELRMGYICYRQAAIRWKMISPPRFEQAVAGVDRLLAQDPKLGQMQDWEIERAYSDWLKNAAVFIPIK